MSRDEMEHLAIVFALGTPATIVMWPLLTPNVITIAAGFAIAWSSGLAMLVLIAFVEGFTRRKIPSCDTRSLPSISQNQPRRR